MRFHLTWFVLLCNLIVIQVSPTSGELISHNGTEVDVTITEICFLCHNNSKDKKINSLESGCSIGNSHPVFIYYPPDNKTSLFSPKSDAEAAGLIFPNGQLTCISCHHLKIQGEKHLAIDNSGSRLCLACHLM